MENVPELEPAVRAVGWAGVGAGLCTSDRPKWAGCSCEVAEPRGGCTRVEAREQQHLARSLGCG
jgi:hypothetical protein